MEMRNDYGASFNDRTSQATGTFGRSNAPFEMLQGSKHENESKKPWRMDFSLGDKDEENEVQTQKDQKKAWKMEFTIDNDGDNSILSCNKF